MDGVKPSRDLPRVALCRVPDTRQRYDLPSVILCPVPGTRQRVVCLVFMLCRVPRGQALGKEPFCRVCDFCHSAKRAHSAKYWFPVVIGDQLVYRELSELRCVIDNL